MHFYASKQTNKQTSFVLASRLTWKSRSKRRNRFVLDSFIAAPTREKTDWYGRRQRRWQKRGVQGILGGLEVKICFEDNHTEKSDPVCSCAKFLFRNKIKRAGECVMVFAQLQSLCLSAHSSVQHRAWPAALNCTTFYDFLPNLFVGISIKSHVMISPIWPNPLALG